MAEEYNPKNCEERHHFINKGFEKMDIRLKKVENRFLAIMTILVVNLLGVIGTLALSYLKLKGGP